MWNLLFVYGFWVWGYWEFVNLRVVIGLRKNGDFFDIIGVFLEEMGFKKR